MGQPVNPIPPAGPDLRWFNDTRDRINEAYANPRPTAQRPPKPFQGQMAFDTTLGKPIWCKTAGATVVWVDATGATV